MSERWVMMGRKENMERMDVSVWQLLGLGRVQRKSYSNLVSRVWRRVTIKKQ